MIDDRTVIHGRKQTWKIEKWHREEDKLAGRPCDEIMESSKWVGDDGREITDPVTIEDLERRLAEAGGTHGTTTN